MEELTNQTSEPEPEPEPICRYEKTVTNIETGLYANPPSPQWKEYLDGASKKENEAKISSGYTTISGGTWVMVGGSNNNDKTIMTPIPNKDPEKIQQFKKDLIDQIKDRDQNPTQSQQDEQAAQTAEAAATQAEGEAAAADAAAKTAKEAGEKAKKSEEEAKKAEAAAKEAQTAYDEADKALKAANERVQRAQAHKVQTAEKLQKAEESLANLNPLGNPELTAARAADAAAQKAVEDAFAAVNGVGGPQDVWNKANAELATKQGQATTARGQADADAGVVASPNDPDTKAKEASNKAKEAKRAREAATKAREKSNENTKRDVRIKEALGEALGTIEEESERRKPKFPWPKTKMVWVPNDVVVSTKEPTIVPRPADRKKINQAKCQTTPVVAVEPDIPYSF